MKHILRQPPKKFIALLVILLIGIAPAMAEIYKWVDTDGKTHYSDSKPASQEQQNVKKMKYITNTYKQVKVFDLPASEVLESDNPKSGKRQRVVMYSTESCGYCKKAKRYFEQNKIPYREYNINKSEKARKRWKKLGGQGVPVILIGKKKMTGFSADRFDKLYNG